MKKICMAGALILCILLGGCMPFAAELLPVDQSQDMPLPSEEPAQAALGDQAAAWQTEALLYYPAQSQQALLEVHKTIEVGAQQTLEECLVQALLEETTPAGAKAAAPAGTTLLGLWRSGKTAVVNLSIEAEAVEGEQALFFMRAAIAQTLCVACELESVDVLVDGRALSAARVPQGALGYGDNPLSSRWMQLLADEELAASEQDYALERRAVLYLLTADGQKLVPCARMLTFQNGEYLSALIDALQEPLAEGAFVAPLSAYDTELIKEAELAVLSDGRHVARLTIEGGAIKGENEWMTYGALTCTLTGFLTELDGVQIYIGAGQLARLDTPQGEVVFEEGVLTRDMFEGAMGRETTIYMTADNGQLRALTRVMAAADALSPRMTMAELFGEPKSWETGVQRVVPDGLTSDDLLGVRIENGEATLNFSARFYAGCQRLSAQQERNLVYALVNTLTERPDVDAVRFQIEGASVDKLVSSISLRGPLLRNPGLILTDEGH